MPAKPKSFAPMAAETVRFAVMSQCLRVPVFQAAIKLFFWLFHRLRRGPGRPPHRRAGGGRGGPACEKIGEERSALRGIICGNTGSFAERRASCVSVCVASCLRARSLL